MVDSVQLVFQLSTLCCFNGIHNTNLLLHEPGNLNRNFIWNFFSTNCSNRIRNFVQLMSNLIKPKFISNKVSGGFSTGRTGSIEIYKKMTQGANSPHPFPLYPAPQNRGGSALRWTDPILASIALLLAKDGNPTVQRNGHMEICNKETSDLHLTDSTGSHFCLWLDEEQILLKSIWSNQF